MTTRSVLSRRLVDVDQADPRVMQSGFALLYLLALLLGLGGDDAREGLAAVSAAIVALATIAAALAPWHRLPHVAVVAVPLADVAALGLTRLALPATAVGLLIAIPAIWLARELGMRGSVLAGLATTALVSLPWILLLEEPSTVSLAVLLPLLAWVAGMLTTWTMDSLRGGYVEARARGIELAEALRTIEHQRAFADAILDTVDVGLLLLGPDGTYRQMNRRHHDFLALAFPDGHLGRAGQRGAVFAADNSTLLGREQLPSWRAAQGEEFDDVRIWVGADPAARLALSVSSRVVRDDAGRMAGAAMAYKDITEIVRNIRSKDEFVAAVSHELRTPLTSIAGYAQVLLDDDGLTERQARQLGVVSRNAERLNRLVSDLLQTAKLDDGVMQVVRSPGDLAGIARDSISTAATVAAAQGVALLADLPAALPCRVDAQRISQVLDNLLSNAVKYTPAGGEVTVHAWDDGECCVVAVRDTGIGMQPADVERLFSRFFRAREAAQRSIQGVGLGLSIAKAIVDAHQGRIEVSSEPGVGSEFRVLLPRE